MWAEIKTELSSVWVEMGRHLKALDHRKSVNMVSLYSIACGTQVVCFPVKHYDCQTLVE